MNSLTDLKHMLEKKNITVDEFNGHTLVCEFGTFMLGPEGFYQDGVIVVEKELIKMIEKIKIDKPVTDV